MTLKILCSIVIFSTIALKCCENAITIRPATSYDLNAIKFLSHQHYQHEFKKLWEKKYTAITPSHHTTDSFVDEKMINADANNEEYIIKQSSIENSSERFLVAVSQRVEYTKTSFSHGSMTFNSIIGFCRFEKRDPQTMYINFIFID